MHFFLVILLVLTQLFSGAATPAVPAHTAEADFSYEIENGKATIWDYSGSAVDLIVPDTLGGYPVAAISVYGLAFTSLQSVTLPDSLEEIQYSAFCGNEKLKSITLPKNVAHVAANAFALCDSLENVYVAAENTTYKSVDGLLLERATDTLIFLPLSRQYAPLPEGIRGFKTAAFSSLHFRELILPKSLTRIESEAFSLCFSLESIHIPKNVTEIGENPFYACLGLESITVDAENPVFEIQDGALVNKETGTLLVYPVKRSGIRHIVQDNVKRIAAHAFDGAKALTRIDLPESLESIGESAFEGCTALKELTLPARVSDIASGAFTDCTALRRINVHEDNPLFTQIDGVLFTKDKRTLLAFPAGKTVNYTVPAGTEIIGNDAFSYCYELLKVILPDGLTAIGDSAFNNSGVLEIKFPASLKEIGADAFSYSDIMNVLLPEGFTDLGAYAFHYCTKLKSVSLPASLKSISDSAFMDASRLTRLDIKEGTVEIAEGAFYGCETLESVSLPNGVLRIGDDAFGFCTALEKITLPSSLEFISDIAFYELPATAVFIVPKGSYAEKWAIESGYRTRIETIARH